MKIIKGTFYIIPADIECGSEDSRPLTVLVFDQDVGKREERS